MKKETLESKILPKSLSTIFKYHVLPVPPTVLPVVGLFEMFPLGFRICIIQFFQKSTLNCRQTSPMTTDLFVLNNKIQYKWNLKFRLEWLRMCYVIDVLGNPANSRFSSVSDRKYLCLTRRETWVTIVQSLLYSHYCTRSKNFEFFSGQKFLVF